MWSVTCKKRLEGGSGRGGVGVSKGVCEGGRQRVEV